MDQDEERRLAEFVIEIKNRLDRGPAPDAKSSWIIDGVPENWRGVHNNAFDPEMINIGPLSVSSEVSWSRLQVMEGHKRRFLIRLLGGKKEQRRSGGDVSRTTEGERESDDRERELDNHGGRKAKAVLLDDLGEAMLKLEEKTRAFYSKKFYQFQLETLVLDGCFVVGLLRLYYDLFHTKSAVEAIEGDPIFTNPRILATLRRDLLLLENQLPFFVLEKLYEVINNNNNIDEQAVSLEVLAVTFFDPLLPGQNAASKLDTEKPKAHLLELLHSTILQSVSEKVHKKGKNPVKSRLNPKGSTTGRVLHFASELQEAGVQFKKRKGHDILDIEFGGHRTLWVPPLSINDHTISLLLNYVAYELTVDHPKPIFTNYLMFWNSLVNSPGDIQILHKHGIINNAFGSNTDVANLFIRCREVIYDRDLGYLYNEIMGVNEYCEQYYENKYRVWWRSLIRERFSSPWTCLSLFAAIILLLLTALQTIYTVYPYYRPH